MNAQTKSDTLKVLWTLKSKAGIDEENFRLMCYEITGKESTRAMNDAERNKVSNTIRRLYPDTQKPVQRRPETRTHKEFNVIGFPSPAQKEMARDLEKRILSLGNYPVSLEDLSEKMYKRTYNSLNSHQISAVIEAMKSILKRITPPDTLK